MPTRSQAGGATGRPCAADVASRTQALLAVAEDALIERGYEGATLDLIASRYAKVSKKTIYAK
jgi:AcrR family transcriptional regulator